MSDNNTMVPQWRYEVLEAKCERQADEIVLLKEEIAYLKDEIKNVEGEQK